MQPTPGKISPAGFFVLRSPLLPYDDLAAWSSGLEAPAAVDDPERLDDALQADRSRLRSRLAEIVARPDVRDALYVGSPDLDGSLPGWHANPRDRRGQRVERALVRYVERMAARATPFGLFAGCAVGQIADETRLQIADGPAHRRHTRLDMHYVCALIAALERDPEIRAALEFRPNSSLYQYGERWHWIELTPDDQRHSHRYRRRACSPWLDAVVERARAGTALGALVQRGSRTSVVGGGSQPLTPQPPLPRAGEGAGGEGSQELLTHVGHAVLAIVDAGGGSEPHACAGLLDTLVDQQFLVSELQPPVTGPEPIHGLIDRLDALAVRAPLAARAATVLREVRDALDRLDGAGLGATPEQYAALTARLEALPAKVERSRLFQVELIKTPADAGVPGPTLGPDVLQEIERSIEILRRLHFPARDSLGRFREAFVARYEGVEARREVPLVEAFDPEDGLSFGASTGDDGGTPLLEGLPTPAGASDRTVRWGPRQTFLLAKLTEALTTGATEIEMTDADLQRLSNPEPLPLPDAFSTTAIVAAASDEAVARGEFRVLSLGVAGPSGARMLGRFCHGDPTLREHVQQYLHAEEAARLDAVFAEIAHLPEPRAGNVIHRPLFRDHEITYLGTSGAPLERQIPITDLMVSVEGERVVLRSARLGREVIPRLTCAQNYFHLRTTLLYRFLGALQDQAVATKLGWDWGPIAGAPYLPRVTHGRLVLARAHWTVDADEATQLSRLDGAALFRGMQEWRAQRRMPRLLRIADLDNELLIDFDNVLSVESFAQLLKGRERTVLIEAFPGPGDLCARGTAGRYFHELSIPYLGVGGGRNHDDVAAVPEPSAPPNTQSPTPKTQRPTPITHSARTFPPGSEWLYAKLYAGPSTIDTLLRCLVRPVVDRALGEGAADGWFFIRYTDPEWHLRLRFHGDPARLHATVLPALQQAVLPLVESGLVRRMQFDTYEREVERYGGPAGMPLCEAVFQADSQAVLETVEALDDDALADSRWKLAVPGLDLLLEGLGLDLDAKLAVLRGVRDGFAREHHADQALLRQIGERFRTERGSIEPLLDRRYPEEGALACAAVTLPRLAQHLAPAMAMLRQAAERGDLTISLSDLAPSLLHMHANRMLRTDQRRQEMVLYDFLYRLYDARAARARGAGSR